jgi:cob(I)alamin adenosyltransferase
MTRETPTADESTAEPEADASPGRAAPIDRRPTDHAIEASAPEEFGLVQIWWGDGKGKTTASLGMALRAVGHGYRVHVLQFMKGGTPSVEDVRGEYNAIASLPGFSFENAGHYGWHVRRTAEAGDHEAQAQAGLERATELVDAAREVDGALPLDGPSEAGVHMLVLDEILYAVSRGLLDPGAVVDLVEAKPDDLELVVTGSHEEPTFLYEHADLVTHVRKEKHPMDAGQGARKGTEF